MRTDGPAARHRSISGSKALRQRDLAQLRDCLGLSPHTLLALLAELLDDIDALPVRHAPQIDVAIARSHVVPWIPEGDLDGLKHLLAAVYPFLDATDSDLDLSRV